MSHDVSPKCNSHRCHANSGTTVTTAILTTDVDDQLPYLSNSLTVLSFITDWFVSDWHARR